MYSLKIVTRLELDPYNMTYNMCGSSIYVYNCTTQGHNQENGHRIIKKYNFKYNIHTHIICKSPLGVVACSLSSPQLPA